jgi:hypothetical protein
MKRQWRFSSFKLDCALCPGVLLAFTCWALIDASFSDFLNPKGYIVIDGQGNVGHFRPDHFLQYSGFTVRAIVLFGLGLIWLVSFADIAYRLARGTANDRSLRSLLLVVTLLCLTCGLVVGIKQLNKATLYYRVAFALAGFKEDAAALEGKWPTENGELPNRGKFKIVDKKNSHLLLVNTPYWSMEEHVGSLVLLLDDGGYAFDLKAHADVYVENHPHNGHPNSHRFVMYSASPKNYRDCEVQFNLVKSIELEPGWFLVTYQFEVLKGGGVSTH